MQQRNATKSHTKGAKGDGRVLPRELIGDGQGKCDNDSEKDCKSSSDMEISAESTAEAALQATATDEFDLGKGQVLLRLPITHPTGKIDTGATTHLLRKQNKLLEQPIICQWKKHCGATILPNELWRNRLKTSEANKMAPQGLTLTHQAAELLNDWENCGCPTKTM